MRSQALVSRTPPTSQKMARISGKRVPPVEIPRESLDQRRHSRAGRGAETRSMLVDGGVGVIVAPVEPVIFQRGEAVQAFALRGTGSGAALEVPFARGGGVEQRPGVR